MGNAVIVTGDHSRQRSNLRICRQKQGTFYLQEIKQVTFVHKSSVILCNFAHFRRLTHRNNADLGKEFPYCMSSMKQGNSSFFIIILI